MHALCVHSCINNELIRILYFCDQVLFQFVIVVGPVAVGQARLASEFAFHPFMKSRVVF